MRLYSGKNSFRRRFNLYNRFVGFDFEERLTFGDAVPFLFAPGNELAGFLRHLEGGHYDAEGHR